MSDAASRLLCDCFEYEAVPFLALNGARHSLDISPL